MRFQRENFRAGELSGDVHPKKWRVHRGARDEWRRITKNNHEQKSRHDYASIKHQASSAVQASCWSAFLHSTSVMFTIILGPLPPNSDAQVISGFCTAFAFYVSGCGGRTHGWGVLYPSVCELNYGVCAILEILMHRPHTIGVLIVKNVYNAIQMC